MSLRQGDEASNEPENYSLCVINRASGTLTTKEEFKKNAKFVIDIGDQIGGKVEEWREGLSQIKTDEDISVELDSKVGFVNIKKAIWENGIDFDAFVRVLKEHFKLG